MIYLMIIKGAENQVHLGFILPTNGRINEYSDLGRFSLECTSILIGKTVSF